jgi:hypothetical protein
MGTLKLIMDVETFRHKPDLRGLGLEETSVRHVQRPRFGF